MVNVNNNGPSVNLGDIDFKLKTTLSGANYGFDIYASTEHSMKIKFIATIKLKEKNVRPAFVFEKEGR